MMSHELVFASLIAILLCVPENITGQGRARCPKLQKPWNGNVVGGPCRRFVGEECTFQCRQPYVLLGSRVRVCQADGTWTGEPTSCELEGCTNCGGDDQCPRLNSPSGGIAEGQCNPGRVGMTCRFMCVGGLMLEGPSELSCLSGGRWSGTTPTCRRTGGQSIRCPTLNAPSGGRLVGTCTTASTGDTCQLVCYSGFRPSDTRILTCQQNGAWSNSLPRCIATNQNLCSSIVITEGGYTTGSCNPSVPRQSCTVTCYQGYTLVGTATVTCQENGVWSDTTARCTRSTSSSCPSLPAPSGGRTSGTCSPGIAGQRCNFFCNSGNRLVGDSSLVCRNNGRWSANAPSCVSDGNTCPTLTAPANGALSGVCSPGSEGRVCRITCNSGYTLVGQSSLTCQSGGRWSGSTPTCSRRTTSACPILYSPEHGYMMGTCAPGQVGQTCVFGCDDNYMLDGQRTLTCLSNGRWSSNPPSCEVALQQPALVSQQDLLSPEGPFERENGRNCPELNPPENGEFVECNNRPGGRCVVVCERGFLRSGSRVRTCRPRGTWTGVAPACRRTGYAYRVVPLWTFLFG